MPSVYNSNKVLVFGVLFGVIFVALFLGFAFNAFNINKSVVSDEEIKELSEKALAQSLSVPKAKAQTATPEERAKILNNLSAPPSPKTVAVQQKTKETQKIIDSLSVPR